MNKTLLLTLVLLLMSFYLAAGDFTVIDGGSNSYHVPVYGYSHYGWSRFIYTASELSTAGLTTQFTINKIAFNVQNSISDYVMDNQIVYFAYTYSSSLSGYTAYPNPANYPATYTQVYSGSITWSGPGWMEITLDTPYVFTPDGYVGLEVVWENRDGSRLSGYPKFYYASKSNSSVYKEGGTATSFPTTSGSTSSYHPSFKIITPATEPPNPATATSPGDGATGIDISTELKWASGGGSPEGYKLSLGTDNPPTNMVLNNDIAGTSYQPASRLEYGTTYYWQVVPYNFIGDAEGCSMWSFTTMDDPSITSFPYQESFDVAVPPNGDWQRWGANLVDPITFSGNSLWQQDDWLNIAGTDKAAKINIWSTLNGWLITPLINIPNDNFYVGFDLAVLKYGQTPTGTPPVYAPDDRIAVLVGDGYSWSTANIVREWNNTGSQFVLNDVSLTGDRVVIPLSGHTGRIRIAFYAGSLITNADDDVMINNLVVQEFASPLAAINPSPVDTATDVAIDTRLGWNTGGGDPSEYSIFFGATLPGIPVDSPLNTYNPGTLGYGTTYQWQIVPTNPAGSAASCPVWSFTTIDNATLDAGTVTINELPVNPTVEIGDLQGEITLTATASYMPEGIGLPNYGLVLELSAGGANLVGKPITINHMLGFIPTQIAYRILPEGSYHIISNPGSWTDTSASFILSAKADGDVEVVFPIDADATLPVELSYFNATFTTDMYVTIAWISESETNHSGYNILRSLDHSLSNAVQINSELIDNGSSSGSQTSYSFIDKEVVYNTDLYYWLESVSLDGQSVFAGPVRVYTTNQDPDPDLPELPNVTMLYNAFPNPFNPNTNLRYTVKEAAMVKIDIFNTRGQLIRSMTAFHNVGGTFSMNWDGTDQNGRAVGSGLYLYRMQSGNYQATRKMMMLK